MCTLITGSGIVASHTAGLGIVNICVQFLLLVVLYGTALQQ